MNKKGPTYDYLVIGAGLFGAVFAHEASKKGKKCLVIDKRSHIGGNVYTEFLNGIHVHRYGPHIFHTSDKEVWDYMNSFAKFNEFINTPLANYGGKYYSLPFNMNTFKQMWGVTTEGEAIAKIASQIVLPKNGEPSNLEEQALSSIGRDLYETLIKGYTEKQWGRPCNELPLEIIKRLPLRFTYDNNYFNDTYQGIPSNGYTEIIEKMLENCEVILNENFVDKKEHYLKIASTIVYTGSIDEFFGFCLGRLEYRSLLFKEEIISIPSFQGYAVVNYTEKEVPFTRIVEHKYFDHFCKQNGITIITKEYPQKYEIGLEPYYPINTRENDALYTKYLELSKQYKNVHFKGRLGSYRYFDMDKVVREALSFAKKIIN